MASCSDSGVDSLPSNARILGVVQWELPPLQRYYLATYWASSEGVKTPGAETQIQRLTETAPGRKTQWMFGFDVTEGRQNGLPLELSSAAIGQGWVGIEKTTVESIGSAELEGDLRKNFYDGQSFRQLVNAPLLYGGATWLIVAYLAFMMRDEIGDEWRRLCRALSEPEWASNQVGNWTANREGLTARIRSRIARWNGQKNDLLKGPQLSAAISRRSSLNPLPNPQSLRSADGQALTQVQRESSTTQQLTNPLPSHVPKPPSQGHTIFPGSSPSGAAHSQSKPWDESEWID